jgi:hypothetical protein
VAPFGHSVEGNRYPRAHQLLPVAEDIVQHCLLVGNVVLVIGLSHERVDQGGPILPADLLHEVLDLPHDPLDDCLIQWRDAVIGHYFLVILIIPAVQLPPEQDPPF